MSRTQPLSPQRETPGTHFCWRMSRTPPSPQGETPGTHFCWRMSRTPLAPNEKPLVLISVGE